jgi:DNA-binding MarR family transcriptional regulator
MVASKDVGESKLAHAEGYELWGQLRLVSDGMLRARENELRPFGDSAMQVGALYALRIMHGRGVKPTPSEMARWLFREPSSTISLLNRMEQQGLVRLVRISNGKRQVIIETTEKGKEIYRREAQKTQSIHRILGTLSASERKQLRSILQKLRAKLFQELAEELPY